MLKLVAARREPAHRASRAKVGSDVRKLSAHIDADQALGQATQRAVARGRRTIVDVHGSLKSGPGRLRPQPDGRGRPRDRARVLAAMARQIADIHQRLLMFSASVELEMDRLDLVRADLAQLSADARTRKKLR